MQTWFEYISRTWFEWGKPQNFDPDAYTSYEHSMSDYPQHWGALWTVYYNEPSQERALHYEIHFNHSTLGRSGPWFGNPTSTCR